MDDLRPFGRFGDIDIYSNKMALNALKTRMPYCFQEHLYPGVPTFRLHEVTEERPFVVEDVSVQPVRLMHYKLPIYGYRINDFAYLTDLKYIPDTEYSKLKNLDILVIDALRIEEHLSHQTLEEALANIERIAPKRAYLIHMSHHMGLHHKVQNILPANVFLSYDGLEIETEF